MIYEREREQEKEDKRELKAEKDGVETTRDEEITVLN